MASVALVVAGCSTNSGPKDYNADVESNFMTSCRSANPERKDVPDAEQFCQCAYGKLKENYTFDEFKVLDKKLRDAIADDKTAPRNATDLGKIDTRYVGIVDSCRTSGPTAPGTSTATTTTTAR